MFPDGGFFVFGDLSVKVEGEYRLRFSLFEMRKYVKTLGSRLQARLIVAEPRFSTSNLSSQILSLVSLRPQAGQAQETEP